MDPKQKNVLSLALILTLLVLAVWQFWPLDTKIRKGLDIQGGLSVILTAQPPEKGQLTEDAMQRAETILRIRVDSLGVAEATVQRQGSDSILVQLPGVKDAADALKVIGSTGQLEFVPAESIQTTGVLQQGTKITKGTYKAIFTGSSITKASVGVDSRTQQPVVQVSFDDKGRQIWADFTSKNVNKQIAIVLDGVVQSAPVVQEPILTGDTQISGKFTADEAKRLAAVLQSGALPVSLKFSDTQEVGPTLGAESLTRGVLAALVGLGLVALYMAIYYRGLGVLTWFSLGIFAALFLGALATISHFGAFALTLPGIAGMVLTVGLAADSSILILERFKEEVSMGKTPRSAAKSGTRHAILTSVDADLVTLVSAAVLYFLAIGPVRGFAFTLMLGIFLDLTVAILFTRTVVIMLAETVVSKAPAFFGLKGGDFRG